MATNILESGRGFPGVVLDPHQRTYLVSFAPAGTGAPTTPKGAASMWTVARVSIGLYRITFAHQFNDVICAIVTPQLNALADNTAQLGPINVANRTVDIRTLDGAGALADLAANANNRINVLVAVLATSQKA